MSERREAANPDPGLLKSTWQWVLNILDDDQAGGKRSSITVLDGVRACAILMVVVFHVNRVSGDNLWVWQDNPLTSAFSTAGGMGVTLFFVLSGFLLFMPFAKSLLFSTSWPLVRVYYLRRVFRILPAYYTSLFILILLQSRIYLQPAHRFDLFLFLTFFMDSSRSTFRLLNGPYWTLATEWQFYMILPLICLLLALILKRVPVRRKLQALILCLLGLIIWGLAVRYWGLYYLDHPGRSFLFFPPKVVNDLMFFFFGITGKYTEDFAVGMLLCSLYIYAQHPSTSPTFTQRWQQSTIWLWRVGMLLLVFSVMWHFESGVRAWHFLYPIMPYYNWLSEMILAFAFAMCMAALLFGSPSLQKPFTWRPMRWIALISYSLYIWHLPLIALFATRGVHHLPFTNIYAIYICYWLWVIGFVLPFAVVYFNLVEKPFMRLGDRWRKVIEKKHAEKLKARKARLQPTLVALSDATTK